MPWWMPADIGELGKEDAWAGPNYTTEPAGLLPLGLPPLCCSTSLLLCLLSVVSCWLLCLPRLSQILSLPEPCLSSPFLSRGELSAISVPAHPSFPAKLNQHAPPISQSSQPTSSPCAPQPEVLLTWSFHPSKTTVGKSSSIKRPEEGNWASPTGIFLWSPWSLVWAVTGAVPL